MLVICPSRKYIYYLFRLWEYGLKYCFLFYSVALESALHQFILPQIDNDVDRTERLITIVDSLEPKQSLAFTALLRKQKAFNDHMHTYVKMCEDHVSFLSFEGTWGHINLNCNNLIDG